MITDDVIQNSVLFRTNSNTNQKNKVPFLVPIKDSISDRLTFSKNDSNQVAKKQAPTNALKTKSGLKTDTIKRAINDGFMAAAIGDLDWLKQTVKIYSDIASDSNVSF